MNKKSQFLLWISLSMMSVFFAEVISGSMKYPLLDIWGYVIVIPLYGLHCLLLFMVAKKVFKEQAIPLYFLYILGMIFGLYEDYLTKVLWTGLSPDSLNFMGIAVLDYIVLVFFWHPFFSFIIPLYAFETLMTRSSQIHDGLPNKLQGWIKSKTFWVILILLMGLFGSFNAITFVDIFLSYALFLLVLIILVWALKHKGLDQYTWTDIMPGKKGFIIAFIYLLAIYVFLTLYDRFEVVTLWNQIPIWLSYLLFIGILYASKKESSDSLRKPDNLSFKKGLVFFVVLALVTVFLTFLLEVFLIKDFVRVVTWISWIVIGLVLFVRYGLIRKT
jgi:hypothetical protein